MKTVSIPASPETPSEALAKLASSCCGGRGGMAMAIRHVAGSRKAKAKKRRRRPE